MQGQQIVASYCVASKIVQGVGANCYLIMYVHQRWCCAMSLCLEDSSALFWELSSCYYCLYINKYVSTEFLRLRILPSKSNIKAILS